ncbi:MAG: ferrochelatase [Candidatus Rokubacteria bacterium]|nr:ferrochelatase [Candidatus Rokubacteria bacterium]
MPPPIDAVLLIAFGGPEKPEDIRPFLANVTHGRPIPPARLEEVAQHYARIGGRSPLNELTFRQADALRAQLRADGLALPVYVGMRNWTPYLHETLAAMAGDGVRHALGVILSAYRTEASWERYQANVAEARARAGPTAPEVRYAPEWFDRPGFIAAVADRIRGAFQAIPPAARAAAPLVFTAHSVPVAMADGSPYVAEFTESSRRVAAGLGHTPWSLAYQSRSGRLEEAWLEPDVSDEIRRLAATGARDVVVAPIGFVCDHVEVLYDLDVGARALAAECGVRFHRARTVSDHPAFIAMLGELVRAAESGSGAFGRAEETPC